MLKILAEGRPNRPMRPMPWRLRSRMRIIAAASASAESGGRMIGSQMMQTWRGWSGFPGGEGWGEGKPRAHQQKIFGDKASAIGGMRALYARCVGQSGKPHPLPPLSRRRNRPPTRPPCSWTMIGKAGA